MMNDRLSLLQIASLVAYSIGMAGGQILFKLAAVRSMSNGSLAERALDLIQNGYFLAALILYCALSVLWVGILSVTPLSRAYPFVALAFVLTPLLGGLLFDEAISIRLIGGMALILCGLILVTI